MSRLLMILQPTQYLRVMSRLAGGGVHGSMGGIQGPRRGAHPGRTSGRSGPKSDGRCGRLYAFLSRPEVEHQIP